LIREGILTSKRVTKLSPLGELLFRKLLNVVDDYGRFEGDPDVIRARCYPLQLKWASEQEIAGWLAECCNQNLIRFYEVENTTYLQVERFKQQIRTKSRFPEPANHWIPDDADNLPVSVKQLLSSASVYAAHPDGNGTDPVKRLTETADFSADAKQPFADAQQMCTKANPNPYPNPNAKKSFYAKHEAEAKPQKASGALTVTRRRKTGKVEAAVARAPMAAPGAPPPGGKKGNRKQPGSATQSGAKALAAVAAGDHSAAAIANARDVIRSKLGPGATEADIDRKFLESLPRRAL
jgi:hypothetical protein